VRFFNLRAEPAVLVGVFLLMIAAWLLLRSVWDEHSEGDPGPDSLPNTARSGPADGVAVAMVQGAVMKIQSKIGTSGTGRNRQQRVGAWAFDLHSSPRKEVLSRVRLVC
jgi:hypothetical protein